MNEPLMAHRWRSFRHQVIAVSFALGCMHRYVEQRPGGGPARERTGPLPLPSQIDNEGLDYQFKDRLYFQQEREMGYSHLLPPRFAGGVIPAGVSFFF